MAHWQVLLTAVLSWLQSSFSYRFLGLAALLERTLLERLRVNRKVSNALENAAVTFLSAFSVKLAIAR